MNNSIQNSEVLIGDYIKTLRKKHKIKKSEYLPSGAIPVVDQSQDFVAGYINDIERAYDGQLPVIVFGDHTCTLKYVDFSFAVGADGTQLIRPTKDFDIRYFYYALRNLPLEHFGYQRHFKYLKTSKIFCPPLPTQCKIAAVLSAYDDLIENNTRRIKILEDMAQTLYQEWFVHFRFPGHENVPMVESPLGLIPQGWAVKQLGEMCHVLMGLSPKSEFYNETGEGLPFHQGVTDFGQRFPTDRVYCTIQKRIAEVGYILFSVRAPVGRINVANKKIVIGRGLSAIRSKSGAQAFLLQQLKNIFQEEDTMGSGTIFNAITKADLLGVQLLQPSRSIVSNFEKIVEPISLELGNLTIRNANLRQTRDLLLPKLISGEIDVSELDIDTAPKSN
ncbi:MAG: restriction endonuclease subunit S [Candidatus Poribacteria bacterium]|nr:restriction endonuclease subunit S [Candidatus Poribacteria bacterium]